MRKRTKILSIMLVTLLPLLAGCARFPTDIPPNGAPARTLFSEMSVVGTINPNYYYYLALDTDGNPATGPAPVAQGVGWGVISPTPVNQPVTLPDFYVVYHGGLFMQYRGAVAIGPPYRGELPDPQHLLVEIDQALIATTVPSFVQLNWITQEDTAAPPQGNGIKQYDGLGYNGNKYLDHVVLDAPNIRQSGVNAEDPELAYNQQYLDGTTENTTNNPAIDMTSWRVEVRFR